MTILITRDNVDALLDAGKLYACMRNGNWWQLRRNGKTRTWKTDASRVYIPVKAGLRVTYAITETDFRSVNLTALNAGSFRHVDDVPAKIQR